jgi:ribosomal protein S18 acetylase RimI-like enzyme
VEIRCLADDNGNLLGMIILYLHRTGEIVLCVNEKRRGLGTKLLAHIEEVAAARALDSVWVWVSNENQAARNFFEKNGFSKEANSMRQYHNKMHEGIKYRKKL